MFDIGASELLVIVIVAVLVIGPKDLPLALRTAGRWIGKIRRVSAQFRSGFDAMVREAEMEEMETKWREQNARIMAENPDNPGGEGGPAGEGTEMAPLAASAEAKTSMAVKEDAPVNKDAPVNTDVPVKTDLTDEPAPTASSAPENGETDKDEPLLPLGKPGGQ